MMVCVAMISIMAFGLARAVGVRLTLTAMTMRNDGSVDCRDLGNGYGHEDRTVATLVLMLLNMVIAILATMTMSVMWAL